MRHVFRWPVVPQSGSQGAAGTAVAALLLLSLLAAELARPARVHAQSPVTGPALEHAIDAITSIRTRSVEPEAGHRFLNVRRSDAASRAVWAAARIDPARFAAATGNGRAGIIDGTVSPEIRNAWLFPQDEEPLKPGLALMASAVLPGTGQFLQGSDRWLPYLALELWGWISFLNRRSDAHDLTADYRDLAWSVARRVSIGGRRDTIFEYYEEMTHYASSGTFDSDPETAGIQPEFDVRTFNGDLWSLSRGLFWGGQNYTPGTEPYEQALDYYLDHAIPPTFTWAWGDSFLEQQSFRELIRRSDEAYRTSTQFLGLILANHVVSAVDALIIGRLRTAHGESRFRVGSGFEPTGGRIPRLRIEAKWRW